MTDPSITEQGPTCTRCDGLGYVRKLSGKLQCARCNGKGWLTKKQEGMQHG